MNSKEIENIQMNINKIKYQIINKIIKFINKVLTFTRLQILIATTIILFIVYSVDLIGIISSTLIGVMYPLFQSYHAIKIKDRKLKENMLKFWIFFSCVTGIENLLWFILKIIPGYYIIKSLFLLWAILPQSRGAELLYDSQIVPFLEKYDYQKFNKLVKIIYNKITEGINEFNADNEKNKNNKST